MKWTTLTLLFVTAVFSNPSHASAADPVTCKSFGINALRVIPDASSTASTQPDQCLDLKHASPNVQKVFLQIQSMHTKIANFFGLSIADTFGSGIEIDLSPGPLGAYASYFSPYNNSVSYGIFLDWNGEPFNESVYIHEVGHFLSFEKSSKAIPDQVKSLATSTIFVEAIADTLGRTISGFTIAPEPLFTSCLNKLRTIGTYQSYDAAESFFESDFTQRRIHFCCTTDPSIVPGSHSAQLCDYFESKVSPAPGVPYTPEPWSTAKLSPKTESLDPHQIGIPLQAFLFELSQKVSIEQKNILLSALRGVDTSRYERTYQCQFGTSTDDLATKKMIALAGFFETVRSQLPLPQDQQIFDQLWKKHGMDILTHLSEYKEGKGIETDLSNEIYMPTPSAFITQSPCFDLQTYELKTGPECEIHCKLVSGPALQM